MVSILVKTRTIPDSWEEYDLQEGLQNFLVVVEMVFFAITHYFVFSHKPYIDPAAAQVPCITTCLKMLDVRDVADDVKEHFVDPLPRPKFRTGRGGGVSFGSASELEKGGTGGSSEESPLLKKKASKRTRLEGVVSDDDVTSHITVPGGSGKLSDLSYDILTYRELDSRTKYGLRARMIANACRGEEERGEGQQGAEEEGEGSTARSSSGEISPLHLQLSPTREGSSPAEFQ